MSDAKPEKKPEVVVVERIVAQGEPVPGMTFGKLPEVLSKLGLKVDVASKGAWAALRTVLPILNLVGFKVHPSRGGPFNKAFLGLTPVERKKWAAKVVENPPADYEEHCRKTYRGQDYDPIEVFWDLVTIGNLPDSVAKVPMTTAHFRSTGLEVLRLLNEGKVDEARAALGRAPKHEVATAGVRVVKPVVVAKAKVEAKTKAVKKAKAKVPAKRKRSGGISELVKKTPAAPKAEPIASPA